MSLTFHSKSARSSILILESKDALEKLHEAQFKLDYENLYTDCHWSTPFQSWAFLTTWYKFYSCQFDPVIVLDMDQTDRLAAFLALARDKRTEQLLVAGTHQAEYQTWLSSADGHELFLNNAFDALQRKYRARSLIFKYLPARAPTDWIQNLQGFKRSARIHRHKRPLIELREVERIAKSLNKKHNRSRINGLKRHGHLAFSCLVNPEEREYRMDEVAAQYDLRQGATNGVCPFIDDPNKKAFHIELMRLNNLLHVSTLTVGKELAAANIGVRDANTVSLGVFSYSPFLARHSPGSILILMLCAELARKGYQFLDLTPGGDWKDRFATTYDEVLEVTVFFDSRVASGKKINDLCVAAARSTIQLFGLRPSAVKSFVERLMRLKLSSVIRILGEFVWNDREFRVYFFEAAIARQLKTERMLRRDSLQDLLAFKPAERWQTRQRVFSSALQKLAKGNHVYTYVENGTLMHSGWLIERQARAYFTEVEQAFTFPSGTAVLFDFYTHPPARGRGLFQKSLREMLRDSAEIEGVKQICISALADNTPSIHVIEKVGFSYALSLFRSCHLGYTRKCQPEVAE